MNPAFGCQAKILFSPENLTFDIVNLYVGGLSPTKGYEVVFGTGAATKFLGLLAVAGLIASFHTIIFAYGRNIYSLSRAGYFPKWLSVTGEKRKTPHVALISGGVIGFLISEVILLRALISSVICKPK